MGERRVRIRAGSVVVEAKLGQGPVADELWEALPIEGRAQIWGDEIYFEIPIDPPPDPGSERETVELGAVGFWPPGKALCLFFGPTPMSRGDEIRPASAVNVLGMIDGDPRSLKRVPEGTPVVVDPA
jgi:uncharacterized protein